MHDKGSRLSGLIVALVVLAHLAACGGSGRSGTTDPARAFPVVVFTDVHFDPFYDPTLFPRLKAADASRWSAIFETSSITAPSAYGADTNYPLLALALSALSRNLGASPLVIFTGDILGHYLPQVFYALNGSDVRNPTPADVAAMKAFLDKTIAFFMQRVRASVGNVPVLFALGNADSYTGLGPDPAFFSDTAQLYYTLFLNGTVDRQAFLSSFTAGGYYSADVADTNLTVIGLNTFEFSPPNPSMSDMSSAVYAQLAWLDSALASARDRGRKVWLLMHVPPGADEVTTSQSVDGSGHITAATMMWNSDYQDAFLRTLSRYPGLVAFSLGAHTHMDEYRIVSPGNVMEITPGITPYFGNDPAFKIFTFSQATLEALDYTVLNCDLAADPPQFTGYYTFSTAFGMPGPLGDSLTTLCQELVTDAAKQALYRQHYYSGRAYSPAFDPITDPKWPVFWSGIGNMDEQGLIRAVNSY